MKRPRRKRIKFDPYADWFFDIYTAIRVVLMSRYN